jgi:hypothetical protein
MVGFVTVGEDCGLDPKPVRLGRKSAATQSSHLNFFLQAQL